MTALAPPVARSKSNLSKANIHNMQIVDEFQDDDEQHTDADSEHMEGTDCRGGEESGKLAKWFKGLFKGKEKSSSRASSNSNSRTPSSTVSAKPAPSPTGARQSPPITPEPSAAPAALSHSKSSTLNVAMPNGPAAKPSKSAQGEEAPQARPPVEDALSSPSNRSKSISLKSELARLRASPMSHSKSFTELSNKARTVPKRGNELLVASPSAPPRMVRQDWSLRDYAVVEKMYKGYASSVYKAFCKRSGELVCLKAYDMAALCELNRFQIYREVQLHGKLAHANVIGLYGAFQVDSQVVMVQEFADGGDLFTLLHRYGGRMPERQAVEMVLLPCLKVLLYLHEQGMLHRDLKPENILFTRNMTFKLCDFGLAIDLRDERAVTRAGTLEYMAPEVLECPFKSRPIDNKENERLHYTAAVDAWAVGVLAYELLVGRPPFEAAERDGVEECIRKQTPRFPFGLSELARSFISTALQKDPEKRPTVADLLAHPLITGAAPRPAPAAAPAPATPSQRPPPIATATPATTSATLPDSPKSPSGQFAPRPPPGHPAAALLAGAGSGGSASNPSSGMTGQSLLAKKAVGFAGSRAVAAAGGMDSGDDFGIGGISRMKSYTAGKAIAISHQAVTANRHMHLPHQEEDKGARGSKDAPSSPAFGGPHHQDQASTTHVAPAGNRLAQLNPKLAAQLGAAPATGPGGMVGRTASVSRIM